MNRLSNWVTITQWVPLYDRQKFVADATAAAVVTLMLIPQSLAYAQLAGMPLEAGLYASMLPLVAYALFGSSSTLAVGPAAVTSLMTASALAGLPASNGAYALMAALLATMSGLMLLAMGAFRLGFLANFLSHPVISGFVSASGILIAANQLKHLLGIGLSGQTLPQMLSSLWQHASAPHTWTTLIGLSVLAFLIACRRHLKRGLLRLGLGHFVADVLTKAAPVMALAVTALLAWSLSLDEAGVRLVGPVPAGLPSLSWPWPDADMWPHMGALAQAALLISLVGFVESVSVGQSLAARRRERIDPDAELRALGASNLAAGVSGGFPVTGGFSRSVVNFDAGARTPAAGIYTATGLVMAALFLTPLLRYLPQATLAATIVVAVLSLVDLGVFKRTWAYSRADFAALTITFALTLLVGVEAGLIAGVGTSIVLYLWRSSRPHIAIVGQVPGTEHYRNVLRHQVITDPQVLGLRVDESLYFANARYLEDQVAQAVANGPAIRHVILQCNAINDIDASALESLETIAQRLKEAGIALHLSEVKGPVMDRLRRSSFLQHLGGEVFLSHHQAVTELSQLNKSASM